MIEPTENDIGRPVVYKSLVTSEVSRGKLVKIEEKDVAVVEIETRSSGKQLRTYNIRVLHWDDLINCGCCGRDETKCRIRGKKLPGWTDKKGGLPPYMCSDCFKCWYSGGMTDPEKIKAVVLEKAGENQK